MSTTRTTIVITTHYIEEARQANVVSEEREGGEGRRGEEGGEHIACMCAGGDDEGWEVVG